MRGRPDRRPPDRPKRPNLRLTFSSFEEIRCTLLTIVIRVEALRQKYTGGLKGFVETYGAQCNRKLVFQCVIGQRFVDHAVRDLKNNGLIEGEDFVHFDATTLATFYNQDQEVDLGVNWLKGFIQNHDIKVYYSG